MQKGDAVLFDNSAKIRSGTRSHLMTFSGKIAVALSLGSVLACSNLLAAQANLPQTQQPQVGRKHRTSGTPGKVVNTPAPVATQPQVQVPAYVPPPLRPAQMAAIAPRISYQNGQLTVVAENANLSDILNGIRAATGVKIETAGGAGGERVAATIGPASVRDVLLSLLQGSRYDFILMGSLTDPDRIERVVLTPKSTTAGVTASNAARPVAPAAEEAVQEENETDSDDNAGFAPAGAQPAPPQNPPQPGAAINPAQPAAQPDAQQGVKTPEQLLQDLRNMQQQQQQQQTPTTPPTSPDQLQRPPRTSRPQ
jgi:hypothetical protein